MAKIGESTSGDRTTSRTAQAAAAAGAAVGANLGADACVRGPSYPLAAKWVATLLVAAVAAWFTRLWPELQARPWRPEALVFVVAMVSIIGTGWWIVLTGETSIDGQAIRQKALWRRDVALADITGVKLVRLPGLDGLVAPRLLVRHKGFGVTTFTAGDRRLVEAFRLLVHGPA